MEVLSTLVNKALTVSSIWDVVIRGAIWFIIAIVIIVSVDNSKDGEDAGKNLRSNLGFLLMFLILSGGLVYLLFGYTPA